MKAFAWFVFLAFVGISSTANYFHGDDRTAGLLLATVPVGFAVVVFLLEGLHAKGKATRAVTALLAVVAGGAGIASYLGLYGMAREHGVQQVPALLLPLAFDGVVAVASLTIRAFGAEPEPAAAPNAVVRLGSPSVLPTLPNVQPFGIEWVRPERASAAPNAAFGAEQGVRAEPNSGPDRVILEYGMNPNVWPGPTQMGAELGVSKSTASAWIKKARTNAEPAERHAPNEVA